MQNDRKRAVERPQWPPQVGAEFVGKTQTGDAVRVVVEAVQAVPGATVEASLAFFLRGDSIPYRARKVAPHAWPAVVDVFELSAKAVEVRR